MIKKILCVVLALLCVFGISTSASAADSKSFLSYKYSERDNYWYTDKDDAWQHKFGYSAFYDKVAPYIGMEYDYVRVHFEYGGKDWMVQLWKGQYGAFFYGCETGVYLKEHTDEPYTENTVYRCAEENERLEIQTTLYRYDLTGKENKEFSTPKEKTWWSTGFKTGHLYKEEPADELMQTGSITFDTSEMADAFAAGLKECGFIYSETGTDSFCVDGSTVNYSWRYISEAENTMPIKEAGAIAVLSLFLIAGFSMTMIAVRLFFLAISHISA